MIAGGGGGGGGDLHGRDARDTPRHLDGHLVRRGKTRKSVGPDSGGGAVGGVLPRPRRASHAFIVGRAVGAALALALGSRPAGRRGAVVLAVALGSVTPSDHGGRTNCCAASGGHTIGLWLTRRCSVSTEEPREEEPPWCDEWPEESEQERACTCTERAVARG